MDIPHRTTIRKRIMEVFDTYLDQLVEAMQVCSLQMRVVDHA